MASYLSNKPILWLWLPLAFIVLQLVMELTLPEHILFTINNENGLNELMQFLMMLAAFCIALSMLVTMPKGSQWWLRGWIAIAALCCFYVAGE